jgi:hypothetical protein
MVEKIKHSLWGEIISFSFPSEEMPDRKVYIVPDAKKQGWQDGRFYISVHGYPKQIFEKLKTAFGDDVTYEPRGRNRPNLLGRNLLSDIMTFIPKPGKDAAAVIESVQSRIPQLEYLADPEPHITVTPVIMTHQGIRFPQPSYHEYFNDSSFTIENVPNSRDFMVVIKGYMAPFPSGIAKYIAERHSRSLDASKTDPHKHYPSEAVRKSHGDQQEGTDEYKFTVKPGRNKAAVVANVYKSLLKVTDRETDNNLVHKLCGQCAMGPCTTYCRTAFDVDAYANVEASAKEVQRHFAGLDKGLKR